MTLTCAHCQRPASLLIEGRCLTCDDMLDVDELAHLRVPGGYVAEDMGTGWSRGPNPDTDRLLQEWERAQS